MASSPVLPRPAATPAPDVRRPPPEPHARRAALVAAVALAVMAVISPLAVFLALPAGRTGPAGWAMLVVAALDVVVALALVRVLHPAGPALARTAAGLRIGYAIVLGIAAVQLLAGRTERFETIWSAGLAVFGTSLAAVAVALWRLPAAGRLLAVLVGIAGLGYLVDALVDGLVAEPAFELGTVTFVGEVVLIVWLVVHAVRRRGADTVAG